MAAEEPLEEELEEGGGKKKLMIIIGVVLLLLGVGGFFAYKTFFAADEMTEQEEKQAEEEAQAKAVGLVTMFPMEPMVVNLADNRRDRYLKITLEFEIRGEDNLEEFKEKSAKAKHSIITLVSSKTYDDVFTVKGKYRLREELLARIRSLMEIQDSILNVYFTEFVIQ